MAFSINPLLGLAGVSPAAALMPFPAVGRSAAAPRALPRLAELREFTPDNFPTAFIADPTPQIEQYPRMEYEDIVPNRWYLVIFNHIGYMGYVYHKEGTNMGASLKVALLWSNNGGRWHPVRLFKQISRYSYGVGLVGKVTHFYDLTLGIPAGPIDHADIDPPSGPFPNDPRTFGTELALAPAPVLPPIPPAPAPPAPAAPRSFLGRLFGRGGRCTRRVKKSHRKSRRTLRRR